MKAEFLTKQDQQLEVMEAARRVSLHPCPTDVDNEASVVSQDAFEFSSERAKPINILARLDVAVILLAYKAERRTRSGNRIPMVTDPFNSSGTPQMCLGGAHPMLPFLTEVLAVDHSINGIVTQVGVDLLNFSI